MRASAHAGSCTEARPRGAVRPFRGSSAVPLAEAEVVRAHGLHRRAQRLLGRQEGGPEPRAPRGLPKARGGHHAYAGGLEEAQRVEVVRCHAALGGGLVSAAGHLHGGEGVHGAPGVVAGEARDGPQAVHEEAALAREAFADGGHLCLVGGVALVPGLRGPHHEGREGLPREGGAEGGGGELEELGAHVGVDVEEVHVAPAPPALPEEPLGGGVEGDELQVRGALVQGHLPARDKALPARVNVLLVHLVRQQHEPLAHAEVHHPLQGGPREDLARGVARVNEHAGPGILAQGPGLVHGPLERLLRHRPVAALVQQVALLVRAQQGDEAAVDGVLGHGEEHRVVGPGDDGGEHLANGRGGAVLQKDVPRVAHVAVPLRDEARDVVTEATDALRGGVGAHAALPHGLAHLPGALDGVPGEQRRGVRVVHAALGRQVAEREHLAEECERPLAHGLGVADVGEGDAVEGELRTAPGGELLLDLLGADDHVPSDRVLHLA
mmetsp:Transcript_15525/g.52383  ORF Transcript_15525/g.52383 Transcript_15525/m.52383 type:complete len:495 (-) Transcript_15525:215-1699(-)